MVLIDSSQNLLGPDKQQLTTHGHTNLKINIAGLDVSIKAIVADISQNLIIGAHFLSESRANISFITNTVTMYDDLTVPILHMAFPDVKYSNNCKVLAAIETTAIPPRSLAWIPVTFSPKPKTDIITAIQTNRPDEHQILSTNKKIMRYINETDDILWITYHQVLGLYDTNTYIAAQHSLQINHTEESEINHARPSMGLLLSPADTVKRWNLLKETLQETPFHLSPPQIEEFFQHLEPLQFVMALEDEPLGLHEDIGEVIKTNCKPIRHKPRPLSQDKQLILEGIITDFKKRGILVDSHSPWSSCIQLVPKKDGKSHRL